MEFSKPFFLAEDPSPPSGTPLIINRALWKSRVIEARTESHLAQSLRYVRAWLGVSFTFHRISLNPLQGKKILQ